MREGIEAICRNLDRNTGEFLLSREIRLGYLAEAAREAFSAACAEGCGTLSECFAYSAGAFLPGEVTLPADAFPDNCRELVFSAAWLAEEDRVAFSEEYLACAERRFCRPATLSDFPEGTRSRPAGGRILYVESPHAESAFSAFSSLLGQAEARHAPSFREVCNGLDGGYADYAILPLSSADLPLVSVRELIFRYGLHIASLCPLTAGEEGVVMALLSREAVALQTPTRFRFRFSPEESGGVAPVLSAAKNCGLSVLSFDILPLSYEEGRRSAHATLAGESRGFVRYLAYLTLFLPGFTGYGFYSETEGG